MRLLHTGDLHIGLARYGRQTPQGNSRVLDFAATLSRFVDIAIDDFADAVLVAGDTFHTRTPGPRELALVTAEVKRATAAGLQWLMVPGNHDGPATMGDATSHTLEWLRLADLPGAHVFTQPGNYRVSTRSGPLQITALPYPHRRGLDTLFPDLHPDERVEEVSRRVERLIEALAAELDPDLPRIFLGHLSVAASKLGSEQTMRIGWDVTVRADVFDGYDYAALGHIHRAQAVRPHVIYPGSPDYHIFEDARQTKAFIVAHLPSADGARPLELERVPSGARRMLDVSLDQRADGTFDEQAIPAMEAFGLKPLLRLTLNCTVERPRQAEQRRLRDFAVQRGAEFVKIEPNIDRLPDTRARADVQAESSPDSALEAWLKANPEVPMEPTLTLGKELIAAAKTDAA